MLAIHVMLSLLVMLGAPDQAQTPPLPPDHPAVIEQLFQEVHLAQFLRRLDFDGPQLEALLKAARAVDLERQKHRGSVSLSELRDVLLQLRKALLEGAGEEVLDPLYQQLEQFEMIRGRDESVGRLLMPIARGQARELVKLLTPSQVTRLVGEEGGDPARQLMELVSNVRRNPQREPEAMRELPTHLSRLLSGGDPQKEERLLTRLRDFVTSAVQLTPEEFKQKEAELSNQAKDLIRQQAGNSIELISLLAEGQVTEPLLNPRFLPLIEQRLAVLKQRAK